MYASERFNAYSHLIGTVLAIAGLVILVVKSSLYGDAWRIVSSSIYGSTLVILYGFSTLYHSIRSTKAKQVLQKFDHCSIYLLIAGSYTPFALVTLNGAWGWTLFGLVWGLCVLGIIQDVTIFRKSQTRLLSLIIYVLMGWIVLIAIKPLVAAMPFWGLFWLVAGGLAYSIGVYWFVNDEKIRHGHGIWHLFVLAGSIAHYICIFLYVS
ncbi:MAG: hemolysin III family protein [Neisseriaceae bacterium]|nr:hemolysin III family protein [Neisseriaceae bacterium]MBP6863058.1 hemolysin III family protein [Neisseriaceae bacterium]